MGVGLSWDASQPYVVVLTLTEEWTYREALAHFERALHITQSVSNQVMLIVDMSSTSYLPPSGMMDALMRGHQMNHPRCPNLIGAVLVMPPSSMREMLVLACKRIVQDPYAFTVMGTLSEAEQFIQHQLHLS